MSALLESSMSEAAGEKLKPYVPRLLIEWMRDTPDVRYRAIEGSLVFVDISGFTALTERLARRGKVGAEIMRDTLDGVFTALLDEAYDWGAGLLKWGGDALLLLFDGPLHAERAARACWEMQLTLDQVGRLRVGGGTIVLRMSIGITTGTLEFFLAGSVHRELLIAGPGATETVTIEAIADAGEIGLSPALAAALDPRCVGPAKEQARLLVAPPDVERDRAPDVGSVNEIEIASCIPIAARSHVLLDRSEPEHRTITAAFIDLMDTDDLLERLGPDALAEGLDERLCAIQEAALKYDVPFYETDVGKGSVKALLTAGAPSSTGQDEERMLRALREIMDRPGIVPMRIGVNTGKVFTGDFGPPYRRAYRVFGDAINTAARVMSKAEPGQILSTQIVLDRSRTTFQTTPIEPFAAKGKSEPIRASIVGPVLGQRESVVRETPMVGRERELAGLLRVVDDARQSKGWIVDISGGPGLGKTRLVQDVLTRAADVFIFHTHCQEYESSTPYFPLRAPFRAVLDLEPSDSAEVVERRLRMAAQQVDPAIVPWVPLLGVLLGVDISHTPETEALDERFIPERLADVMTRFLYTSLVGTTTMLVVEDAQNMDESSRDLLRRLALAGVERKQVLFVTHDGTGSLFDASQTDELNLLSFTLAPLTLQAAIEMVNAVTEDDPLPPHVVEEIARRSAGSPLFLFELLDVVRETGSVEALPDSVEAVVAADIDRLSPGDRTVLRYASVLGTTFDPFLLAEALRGEVELDEEVWSRLGELIEADSPFELRFRNTLIRDAAYEGLPFRRRRVLHDRLGEAIEARAGEEKVGALALHFSEAQRHDKAWSYGCLAGDRAKAIYANVEAARFYERALAASRRVRGLEQKERAAVWISLGSVRESVGLYDASLDALRRATHLLAGDPIEQARVYDLRAKAQMRAAAYGQGLRETARGLRLVDGLDLDDAVGTRASLRASRATIRWYQGRAREAVALATTAAGDAERAGNRRALATAYVTLDGAYQMLGHPEKAVNERQAVRILEELGELRLVGIIQSNLGVQAYADGKWDEAVSWYRQSVENCMRAGDRMAAANAAANLGEALVSQGAYDEAEPILRDARRALRASGPNPYALFAELQLGRIVLARAPGPDAVAAFEALMDEAAATEHALIKLETAAYLAQAHVASGAPEEAGLEALHAAYAAAGEEAALLSVMVDRIRGLYLVALDRLAEADASLDKALSAALQQGMLYEQLLVRQARRDLFERLGRRVSDEELEEIDRLLQLLGLDASAA